MHEVKWDGVRVLDRGRATGRLRMYSRNGNDVTLAWPELSTSPLGDRDLLVDGEVIALNEHGLPDFRVLQDRMHVRNAQTARRLAGTVPATYMVFDLLRLDGEDLTGLPAGGAPRARSRGSGSATRPGRCRRCTTTAPMLFDATLAAGARGHGQQARCVAYPFDAPQRRTG